MAASEIAENVKPAEATSASGNGAIRLPHKEPKLEEFGRRRWFIKAPPGATREDVVHPTFWAAISKYLARHDVVFLLADDEAWELEIRIERVMQGGAEISVSKNISRTPISMAETWIGEDHHTQYRPGDGWCVIRAMDKYPIIRGHALEVSAINQFHRDQPRAA